MTHCDMTRRTHRNIETSKHYSVAHWPEFCFEMLSYVTASPAVVISSEIAIPFDKKHNEWISQVERQVGDESRVSFLSITLSACCC